MNIKRDNSHFIYTAVAMVLGAIIFKLMALAFVAFVLVSEYLIFEYHEKIDLFWRMRLVPRFYRMLRSIETCFVRITCKDMSMLQQLKRSMFRAGYTQFEIRLGSWGRYAVVVKEQLKIVDKCEPRYFKSDGWPGQWVVVEQLGIGTGGGGNYHHDIIEFDGIETGVFINPKPRKKRVENGKKTQNIQR